MAIETLEPRPEATLQQWRAAFQRTYGVIAEMTETLNKIAVAYFNHSPQADRRFCEAMLMFSGMNILERLVDVFENSDLFVEDAGVELLQRVNAAQAAMDAVIERKEQE